VSTPSVTVGPPSAAAGARTTYTVAFSVSATGGLSGATGGTVTMVFPAGTGVNSLNSTSLVDVTTGKQVGAVLGFVSGTTLTFNVFNGQVISPNDIVNAIAAGATNPATPGTAYTVKVSTSSDTTPITSSPYTIVAGHPVKTLSVTVAPSAAAGARTGYTVAFTSQHRAEQLEQRHDAGGRHHWQAGGHAMLWGLHPPDLHPDQRRGDQCR
jgi:hypothetical protein